MTKILFGVSGLALVALVGLLIVGLTNTQPGLLIVSLFCTGPVMTLSLGAALGRASNEFTLVRRAQRVQNTQVISRIERAKQGEMLS